jgi:hypothetical protein
MTDVTRDDVLFDRQVRLWGSHGQRSLRNTDILALGSTVAITEALKDTILPSVRSVTMVDDALVEEFNLSNNFFLTDDDLKQSIAECLMRSLGEMNTSCKTIPMKEPISDFVIKMCINTLYIVSQLASKNNQLKNDDSMSDDNNNNNNNNNLSPYSQLKSYIQQHHPLSSPLLEAFESPNQQLGTSLPSLFDYNIVIVDPIRLPLSLHNILSVLCTTFHIDMITLSSLSASFLIKLTYPQRCTIETHFKTNPVAHNLYLNGHQLQRFPELVQYAFSNQFDILDLPSPPIDTHNTSEYINNKASRAKVPFMIVLIRFAAKLAANAGMGKLDHDDDDDNNNKVALLTKPLPLAKLKQVINENKWKDEGSYKDAMNQGNKLTGALMISNQMREILNSDLIINPNKSILIQKEEKLFRFKFDGAKKLNNFDEFFDFSGLFAQIFSHQKCLEINPIHIRSVPCQDDHKLNNNSHLYGDYNHPFWLLVTALRLFMMNFPLDIALGDLDVKNVLGDVYFKNNKSHNIPIDDIVPFFQHLNSNLVQKFEFFENNPNLSQEKDQHFSFGCLPINPSLPDIDTTTELYGKIKTIYRNQFERDLGLFIIYLHFVLKMYKKQRSFHFSSQHSTDTSWFSNMNLFHTHIQHIWHLEDPIQHFLLHCRELRVNSATTSLTLLPTHHQDLFSGSNNLENKMGEGSEKCQNDKNKNKNNQQNSGNNVIPSLNTLWDLFTVEYLTKHLILSSFCSKLDSSTIKNQFDSIKINQKRRQNIFDFFQNSFVDNVKPYCLDFYISSLSLFQFQFDQLRMPVKYVKDYDGNLIDSGLITTPTMQYSISPKTSKLLKLTPLTHTFSPPTPPNPQSPSQSTLLTKSPTTASDLEQLEHYHNTIWSHLTTLPLPVTTTPFSSPSPTTVESPYPTSPPEFFRFDRNSDQVEVVPRPQLDTTKYLFFHQYSELPAVGSAAGSLASDFLLKLALKQYTMIESTVIYDATHSRGGRLFL